MNIGKYDYTTGKTLYLALRDPATGYLVDPTTGDSGSGVTDSDAAIALTEAGATGHYVGTIPTDIADGQYYGYICDQGGASESIVDDVIEQGNITVQHNPVAQDSTGKVVIEESVKTDIYLTKVFSLGKWIAKPETPGTYQILDPDDGVTPIIEVTPQVGDPYKVVTILL